MRRPTAVTTLARKHDLDPKSVRKFYRVGMSLLALRILIAQAKKAQLK